MPTGETLHELEIARVGLPIDSRLSPGLDLAFTIAGSEICQPSEKQDQVIK
jgi:hypothetical protein